MSTLTSQDNGGKLIEVAFDEIAVSVGFNDDFSGGFIEMVFDSDNIQDIQKLIRFIKDPMAVGTYCFQDSSGDEIEVENYGTFTYVTFTNDVETITHALSTTHEELLQKILKHLKELS